MFYSLPHRIKFIQLNACCMWKRALMGTHDDLQKRLPCNWIRREERRVIEFYVKFRLIIRRHCLSYMFVMHANRMEFLHVRECVSTNLRIILFRYKTSYVMCVLYLNTIFSSNKNSTHMEIDQVKLALLNFWKCFDVIWFSIASKVDRKMCAEK